jgi:thioredoxin reductase/NAD-dependent dihydropyrimidine dehydrogenase PreA subunit
MIDLGAMIAGAALIGGLGALAYAMRVVARQRRHAAVVAETVAAGVTTPPSLHPKIDRGACICTGACIDACPETHALGWFHGRPRLIDPTACVGHGACLRACPVQAIELVIGSEERGVDLPVLTSAFESSVPGLYVCGELAGMGLIHNAFAQGKQVIDEVARALGKGGAAAATPEVCDVAIVGAGPAGIAAALQALRLGLRYRLLEKGTVGGAIRSYPRQKIVMTSPAELPGYGAVKLGRTTKEALLALIEEVIARTGLEVTERCEVTGIRRDGDELVVDTQAAPIRARRVVLATGRRGAPRRIGAPGEERTKVVYELIEPDQYRRCRCVVVGGGDTALETAFMLLDAPAISVDLVHRGAAFDRAKPGNRDRLAAEQATGRLRVHTQASVASIEEATVRVASAAGEQEIANDFVFVCIGGELPTALLQRAGIEVARFHGDPLVQP